MASRLALTSRQDEVFRFILTFFKKNFTTPTYFEVSKHFGWKSQHTARQVVLALEKKGWLKVRGTGKSRSFMPTGVRITLTVQGTEKSHDMDTSGGGVDAVPLKQADQCTLGNPQQAQGS